MAQRAALPRPTSGPRPASGLRSRPTSGGDALKAARRIPLLLALTTVFHEAGLHSATAATMAALAVPLTASVFVYEVAALRGAQLDREAVDRRHLTPAPNAASRSPLGAAADHAVEAAAPDLAVRLDAMLASRASILDTFGDEPASVAPIYGRVIKQMLKEDETTFAQLLAQRSESDATARRVADKAADLRVAHRRLTHLVGF